MATPAPTCQYKPTPSTTCGNPAVDTTYCADHEWKDDVCVTSTCTQTLPQKRLNYRRKLHCDGHRCRAAAPPAECPGEGADTTLGREYCYDHTCRRCGVAARLTGGYEYCYRCKCFWEGCRKAKSKKKQLTETALYCGPHFDQWLEERIG